jgi:regulator of RNase E activity RraA
MIMKVSTADVGDALVKHPDEMPNAALFGPEFAFYTNHTHLMGHLLACKPLIDRDAFRTRLGRLSDKPHVVLVENGGRTDCACFDHADLVAIHAAATGVIVHGAIRRSALFARFPRPVQAMTTNLLPYQTPQKSSVGQDEEVFPFIEGGFVISDSDGMVVLRSKAVLWRIGIPLDMAPA